MVFYMRGAALLPILLPQTLWVRRTVPKLPEPPGDRQGTRGTGPVLRLLVVGDSGAAGVGARSQDDALLGRLVGDLETDHTVCWQLHATSGHKTSDALARLEAMQPEKFDVAVTSLGVNDALSMVSLENWRRQQALLRQMLRDKFSVDVLIISGLPPLHDFPALPQPLRWHFGARVTQFERALAADVAGDGEARHLDLRYMTDMSLMATDGFHPGPGIYAEWARRAAEVIRQRRVC
ncbi:MAG: SGNH/GDSL hydrolase family protein [Woeseiaceae bacterium]|nr:SGNH/GDSL hydrolase family protein [Woeseiaceae bacterium]NIP20814.1 SGNH/GDSL hydrolase family protein [Woeseiaceae bacterium]NIS89607.1 SGNH/GDSL hydrolase family protein [Woeseiaceae bacterium]